MFGSEAKTTVKNDYLNGITLNNIVRCQKTTHSAIEFGTIDCLKDKIELSGTTGGKDEIFSYTLSDSGKRRSSSIC